MLYDLRQSIKYTSKKMYRGCIHILILLYKKINKHKMMHAYKKKKIIIIIVGEYRCVTSLFKAGFDDNEQILRLMFIDRETRQNSSI